MAAPRSPLNPTTASVGFTAKLATVRSVSADGVTAVCVDRQNTQNTVSMLVQRSKGPLPQVGDTWLLSQDLGFWSFAAFVATSVSDFSSGGGSGGQLIIVSAQPPVNPATGQLWMNEAQGDALFQWTGQAWMALPFGTAALANGAVTTAKIANGAVTSAQIAPNAGITAGQVAFAAEDIGGVRIVRGPAPPAEPLPGDFWLDSLAGNVLLTWDGNSWEQVLLGAQAIQPGSLTALQLSAEAGIAASQVNFTYRDLGGMAATISASSPPNPVSGDLWYDATNGYALRQWNGLAWVPYQFGTNAIEAGSITAELIAAEAITAAKIAAGIIIAGIINGTVVEAATFIGSVFEGTDFIVNSSGSFFYSGTPALGNSPIQWETNGALADPFGNVLPGTAGSTGPGITGFESVVTSGGKIQWYRGPTANGPWTLGAQVIGDIINDGSLSLISGTTNVMEIDLFNGEIIIYSPTANGSLTGVSFTPGSGLKAQIGQVDETGHNVTLDAGWSTTSGFSNLQYQLKPDNTVQFTGAASHASITATLAINSSNPLPPAYRPATSKILSSGNSPLGRLMVEYRNDGILYALANGSSPGTIAEVDKSVPLAI
jgi:hypothetical protein